MKKLFVFLLTGIMVFSMSACGQSQTTTETAEEKNPETTTEGAASSESEESTTTGGWTKAEDPVVTDEIKALVEKATGGMTGAAYSPVAYIGSQVVSGTNHAILCKCTPVTPDAVPTYAIVVIYEDLEGNAEVTEVQNSKAQAPADSEQEVTGGWTDPESPAVTEEARAALEKATKDLDGAGYNPIALLGTQVVSGTNYSILCEITTVSPDAQPTYSIVTVYEDLEGNAEITETFDFEKSE